MSHYGVALRLVHSVTEENYPTCKSACAYVVLQNHVTLRLCLVTTGFSVTCKNQTLCEVVTARTSGYKPQIAYIYARSNIVNHQLNQLHTQGQSAESLHIHRKHYHGEKSNRTLHNHKMDGSNDQSESEKGKA